MSYDSEQIHLRLAEKMEELDCNIFEAALEFCEEEDIDPEDIVLFFDDVTKERIKLAAFEDNMVKKSLRPQQKSLPL